MLKNSHRRQFEQISQGEFGRLVFPYNHFVPHMAVALIAPVDFAVRYI